MLMVCKTFIKCTLPLCLVSTSIIVCGCQPKTSSIPPSRIVLPIPSVQQSVPYKHAVSRYRLHDYQGALVDINFLLQQKQYLSTSDQNFLWHQRAICRHALDPGIPIFASPLIVPIKLAITAKSARTLVQADCGPRALLSLCPQFGIHTTLDNLRKKAGTTADGTTMQGLANAAKSLGLKAKGVQMDRDALMQLSNPAIAWYDGNHYIALLSVSEEQVTIHDPNSLKEEEIPTNELLGRTNGFLLILSQ